MNRPEGQIRISGLVGTNYVLRVLQILSRCFGGTTTVQYKVCMTKLTILYIVFLEGSQQK